MVFLSLFGKKVTKWSECNDSFIEMCAELTNHWLEETLNHFAASGQTFVVHRTSFLLPCSKTTTFGSPLTPRESLWQKKKKKIQPRSQWPLKVGTFQKNRVVVLPISQFYQLCRNVRLVCLSRIGLFSYFFVKSTQFFSLHFVCKIEFELDFTRKNRNPIGIAQLKAEKTWAPG